jgi:23S rRNA (pseudouridine1915-N3)-methyltransferase
MKINLLVVGKTNISYLENGIDLYLNRLKHYLDFNLKVIPEPKNTQSLTPKQLVIIEGELILKFLNRNSDTILLDERGEQPSSSELANLINKKMISGTRELTFVIGGPYGFSDEVKKNIKTTLSLSRLTFSHQMVRLIFVEQLYRAMTIIRGEPYHHE